MTFFSPTLSRCPWGSSIQSKGTLSVCTSICSWGTRFYNPFLAIHCPINVRASPQYAIAQCHFIGIHDKIDFQMFGWKYLALTCLTLSQKRHHVDTSPKGGEMNANMVKPLCSWGGKWSLGNGSHTCVKMENSDCLSNLPPGTRSHWKLNPGDSHHKQLRTHTGKHGGLCWVYGAMGLWWIWTAPPSPCIPLAPINPIQSLNAILGCHD